MNKRVREILYRVNTDGFKQEKNISLGMLLDFYGELLTPHQREIAEYSYNDDLSLSEIADITGITRQGVRASLEKTAAVLREFEEKLGLADKFARTRVELEKVSCSVEEISAQNGVDLSEVSDAIEKIRRIYDM